MKDSTRLLTLLFTFLLFWVIGFFFGHRTRKSPEPEIIRDTTIVTRYDTITKEKPVPVYSYIHDTVRTYSQTVYHATVQVDVPIEVKVYQEDSLYRAVVSGWRPSLDTLVVYPKTTEITITNTVKVPPPKWGFGVTAGPSVLLMPKGEIKGGFGVTAGLHYRF